MTLTLAKHEKISLKNESAFSEQWLHDQIADDPTILGLGDIEVIDRERVQQGAGRLDLLLSNSDLNCRYEVEIMFGATDPDHIVRCIEYWDIERRRFPAYDHVAVLVAEDVTGRFLNLMALLAGSIPLIAIQLNALKVGDQLVLDFVRVLDQTSLRRDDEAEGGGGEVDRGYWDNRVGGKIMAIADRVVDIANAESDKQFQLDYRKNHLAVSEAGRFFNLMRIAPKRKYAHLAVRVKDTEAWISRIEDDGLPVATRGRQPGVRVTVTPGDLQTHEATIQELIHQCVAEYQS